MPAPNRRTIEIALVGMRFHVLVGILPHERTVQQPLEVDLRVRHDGGSESVLDYRTLHALVSDVVSTGPTDYLEQLADGILRRALALGHVAWCRVAVRKPHVALGGPLDYAEVAVEGTRD